MTDALFHAMKWECTLEETEDTAAQLESPRDLGKLVQANSVQRTWTLVCFGNESDEFRVSEEIL